MNRIDMDSLKLGQSIDSAPLCIIIIFFVLFVCCVCSHSAIDSERYLASFAYVNQVYKGGVLNIKKGGKKIFHYSNFQSDSIV
jgi:hypothetical protein